MWAWPWDMLPYFLWHGRKTSCAVNWLLLGSRSQLSKRNTVGCVMGFNGKKYDFYGSELLWLKGWCRRPQRKKKKKIGKLTTWLSLMAWWIVKMTTYCAISDDKVIKLTMLCCHHPWLFVHLCLTAAFLKNFLGRVILGFLNECLIFMSIDVDSLTS